ncbi:unnamed protein product, partial [Strongylus vulgaris]
MAWRFQASKFKNTTPHIPKREETIFDVPVGNLSCTNNGIQASASYLAFLVEGEGGKLGLLPIGAKGRRTRKDMSIACAHGEQVDDFCFMTFNDDLLLTCSRDDNVKVWRLLALNGFEDKGQSIDWSEDGKLLAISADKGRQVYVYDVRSGSSPVHNMAVHQGMGRESRVLFCGDRLLSSGFTN